MGNCQLCLIIFTQKYAVLRFPLHNSCKSQPYKKISSEYLSLEEVWKIISSIPYSPNSCLLFHSATHVLSRGSNGHVFWIGDVLTARTQRCSSRHWYRWSLSTFYKRMTIKQMKMFRIWSSWNSSTLMRYPSNPLFLLCGCKYGRLVTWE